MKDLVLRMAGRASDLADTQPLLALCLGAALFAVFLSLWLRAGVQPSGCSPASPDDSGHTQHSLLWTLYHQAARFLLAVSVVLLLTQTLGVLRSYLRKSVANYNRRTGA